jgi:hypothetical protein
MFYNVVQLRTALVVTPYWKALAQQNSAANDNSPQKSPRRTA